MPVSGGLSLGLTIAGVGTGLAAGGMTTGSDIYKKKKHRNGLNGHIDTQTGAKLVSGQFLILKGLKRMILNQDWSKWINEIRF